MEGEWIKRPKDGEAVVVFVHGILSSGDKCWLHPEGGYWPWIVAYDPGLSDLGVFNFTYQTGIFSGTYSLGDAVDALKEHMELDNIVSPSGIIFVCHSMGGIVVRKYLVSRTTELVMRAVPVGLFLVASPSLGSDYANWLAPIARKLRHSQGDALRFVRTNPWLADLDREFLNMKEQQLLSLTGKELIEDKFVTVRRLFRKQVVEPFSGARYFGEPYKVPESDHFSISKLQDDQAIQHRLLRKFILDWRAGLPSQTSGRGEVSVAGLTAKEMQAFPNPVEAVSAASPQNQHDTLTMKLEVSVVLNLTVDFGADDKEGLDRIEQALRSIVANSNITILEARTGSLLLFLADPDGALARFDHGLLRTALRAQANAELVGITSIESYNERVEQRACLSAASGDLLAWPTSLPDGEKLPRPELSQLSSRIDGSVSSTTAILGSPGAGKSALLANLAKSYGEAGWPVLAIKADLLDPDVASEDDLRDRLGLEIAPSSLLRDLARFGPVLLVIDQLDALAGYLDMKTARLSLLLNLVRKLGDTDNVHIVISSRAFEFQHDVRLRSVNAERLMLDLPPWSEVLAVLESHGVAAGGWPPDAKEVMRSPQSLNTYLQLSSHSRTEPFMSYQLMLERLWSERVIEGPAGGNRDRLASDIADAMAEQESLWLASARFSDRAAGIQGLIAAGILTSMGASIGFSHQTLFEFTLARGFAKEAGRLPRFALERQQSLFLRPKLWAGLTYLRAADNDLYHRELDLIWKAELRSHLRVLLIDFLGSQAAPTDREAMLMERAIAIDATRIRAFKAIAGSPGWFARLAHSCIAEAMKCDEHLANAQIAILSQALLFAPEKVGELIRLHWLPDPSNDQRAWAAIQSLTSWNEAMLAIAVTIIARSEISILVIDHQAGSIAIDQPDVALALIAAKLERELRTTVAQVHAAEQSATRLRDPNPQDDLIHRLQHRIQQPLRDLIEGSNEWDSLAGIAERWPGRFLHAVFPWFVRALTALKDFTGRDRFIGFALALEADFRFEGENELELPQESVLAALRVAVECLQDSEPEVFRAWVAENEGIELNPVQRLIAHAITRSPQKFAGLGFDFVMGDERRYFLGAPLRSYSTTRRLVAAVSPYWTSQQLSAFEAKVRRFAPPTPAQKTAAKDKMQWRHMVRSTQLDLLRALPANRRSEAAQRQVVEGERRYGGAGRERIFSDTGEIGSIIEADRMVKASDDDIVNAFVGLPDATGWDNPRSFMAGGNVQLARAFATFAKEHVERAVRILAKLDSSNGVRAAAYTIDALSSDRDAAVVFALTREVVGRGFDSEELRHTVAHALSRIARRKVKIDYDLLKILEVWVTDPIVDETSNTGADELGDTAADGNATVRDDDKASPVNRSLRWGYGGNGSYPGGDLPVAEAVVLIRIMRDEPAEAISFMARYLTREKRVRPWEVLARYFVRLDAVDAGTRAAFLDRVLTEVEGVVGSNVFAKVLSDAQQHDHAVVDRHLDAWKKGGSRAAIQAYGEIVGLDALLHPAHLASHQRLQAILEDEEEGDARAGVALSAAHVLAESFDHRPAAAALLSRLLGSSAPGIWAGAFEFFRLSEVLLPDASTIAFLRTLSANLEKAPPPDGSFVVDRLATLLPHQAPMVGAIALGLVAKWQHELADVRTSTAIATSVLVDLAVTLHRLGPETREVGLTLFEQLMEIDAYEARQMLDEIDNRFRETAPSPRRSRLRRRSEVTPRRTRSL